MEEENSVELKRKQSENGSEEDSMCMSKKTAYPSYTDRYFKKYYKLNVKYEGNDHLILLHSNRVCVLAVALSHPMLDASKYKIQKVEFIQNVNEEMSGKHKNNAKNLNSTQALCKVTCLKVDETPEKEAKFILYSCLNAKLIEVNTKLESQPELLQNKSQTEGFLAILFPKLNTINEQMSTLVPHPEYINIMNNKKSLSLN